MIDISKFNKEDVLIALYNNARPQGLGFLQYNPTDMSKEQAQEILKKQTYFDYLGGRVMKVDLAKDYFDPWLYDRDNGEGAAQKAIDTITQPCAQPEPQP